MTKRLKIPATVLERARAAAVEQVPAKKPVVPAVSTRGARPVTRAKVIAALKKLHPMD